MLSFFPRGVLDEILNLIESVSEAFPSYSSTCQAVAKETVRSPLLYWGLSRPSWWSTNAQINCMQASIDYFFSGLLLHVASQHNITGQTPGSVASACWRRLGRQRVSITALQANYGFNWPLIAHALSSLEIPIYVKKT